MTKEEQLRRAHAFRALHRAPPTLLLPNAWDAMSAGIFAAAGYPAVATTSGGLAWALGFLDGEKTPWPEVVAATARIAAAVDVPVTADIEAGYGETPDKVARHVVEIAQAGGVGVNLEDGAARLPGGLRSIEDMTARIGAARRAISSAGFDMVINARTDVYLHGTADATAKLDEAVRRGKAYLAAGAIASGATLVVMSQLQSLATELRAKGDFAMLDHRMTRAEAQLLFAKSKG